MKHKVLLVLLLGIIISVSASAQKVTMNLKQVKLEKVFSAITQQTGLTVAYSRTIVNPDRIVTVEAKNQELSKVLNDLFLGTNINYEIGKTKIYLKEKVTDSEQQTSNANKRNISGRVVDEKGEPIIGASVMVQGSSLGTITNVDGRYTLANVPESSTITVSYIGYITVNYAATSRNLSQVVLREDSKTLVEVVVVVVAAVVGAPTVVAALAGTVEVLVGPGAATVLVVVEVQRLGARGPHVAEGGGDVAVDVARVAPPARVVGAGGQRLAGGTVVLVAVVHGALVRRVVALGRGVHVLLAGVLAADGHVHRGGGGHRVGRRGGRGLIGADEAARHFEGHVLRPLGRACQGAGGAGGLRPLARGNCR